MTELYPSIDVSLNYQNFGAAWLGILRGSPENIELVFNGLYNLQATENRGPTYHDAAHTVATFWTSRKRLYKFFFNRYLLPRTTGDDGAELIASANRFADDSIAAFKDGSHEGFLRFNRTVIPETYGQGTKSAERPDEDFKDAVLFHAHGDNRVANPIETE